MPDTIITCLHFLEAVEEDKYGWRWECPQGGIKCQYRHQLPEGYQLLTKKEREANKKAKDEADKNSKTIEEQIEEERAALKSDGLTPVTKESFFAWKERRAAKKQQDLEDAMKKAADDKAKIKAAAKGKNSIMNGRALFTYNPELFKDDENAIEEKLVKAEVEFGDNPNYEQDEEEKVGDEEAVDNDLFAGEEVNEDEEVDFD